ncbi:phage holin family protein [Ideonella sp.]|uniref:phage holin family protein n=1 Tax=Ideonella sp. TaxID=1929293 RepID=UPI0035B11053
MSAAPTDDAPRRGEPPPPGVLDGLREAAQRVVADVIDIGRTRLELATLELEQERLRLARLWLGATVTLFLLFVGVVLAAAWIVLLCPPAWQATALGGLTAVFLGAAALAAWRWKAEAERRPPLLHGTLAELHADEKALRGEAA